MDASRLLFWRRSGTMTLFTLGVLLGILAAIPGLLRGTAVGHMEGIQAKETGQVQIVSVTGPVKPYFFVKALAENMTGVLAVSARIEFEAILEANDRAVPVRLRAFNFSREKEVTSIVDQIDFGAPGVFSGLVLSRRLSSDPFWGGRATVQLSSFHGDALGQGIAVVGHVSRPGWPFADDLCYLDLQTAQALLGSLESVTSLSLRLAPGIVVEDWVRENKKALLGYNLVLRPWTEVLSDRALASKIWFGPLTFLLCLLVVFAFAATIVLGYRGRRARSGWALWRCSSRSERWSSILFAVFGSTASFLILFGSAQWLPEVWSLLLDASYPQPVPALWAWDFGVLILPAFALSFCLAVSRSPGANVGQCPTRIGKR